MDQDTATEPFDWKNLRRVFVLVFAVVLATSLFIHWLLSSQWTLEEMWWSVIERAQYSALAAFLLAFCVEFIDEPPGTTIREAFKYHNFPQAGKNPNNPR